MKHGEYEASGLARCLLTRAGLFLLYIISAPSLLGWPDCKKPAQWLATEKRVAEPADEPWAERGHAQSQPADGWAACHQGCWRRSIHGSSRRTGGAGEGARGLHGVPAGRGGSLAPAALDDGMKGVTMEVDDLEEEAEFWIKGLGMREIRKNAKSVVVGYGSDRMVEGGGHFTFELVQAGEERKTAETQRVEIELPNIPYLISRAQEAGGTLIPRWFGRNFDHDRSVAGCCDLRDRRHCLLHRPSLALRVHRSYLHEQGQEQHPIPDQVRIVHG
mmetsp:Transcript_9215/g.30745  ORF Transcript_9215/g.30745 Transcript_9215/m.30745 type:complete len:274 (+) Transcript_9215:274-1095(+)